jgi:small GTP-binding protein
MAFFTSGIFDGIGEKFRSAPSKTLFKFSILGDGSVGKSSYFTRLHEGNKPNYKFEKNYDTTRGCNIGKSYYNVGKYELCAQMYDTAGQECFGDFRDCYTSGVDGIIIMYDASENKSKQSILNSWMPEVKRIMKESNMTNIPIAIVGNKNDIVRKENMLCHEHVGIRTSTLIGSYKDGPIQHFDICVKENECLLDPINWLFEKILSSKSINVKHSAKDSVVYMCNK